MNATHVEGRRDCQLRRVDKVNALQHMAVLVSWPLLDVVFGFQIGRCEGEGAIQLDSHAVLS